MNNQEPSIFREFAESEKKKKEKRKKFLFFFLFIFLFLIPVFLLYERIWDPLWNPFRPKPDKIINLAIEKFSLLEHFKGEADIVFSFEKPKREEVLNLNSHISLFYLKDTDNQERIRMPFTASLFLKKSNIQLDYKLGAEMRKIGNNFYLKIDDVSSGLDLLLRISNIDIQNWKGKWLKQKNVEENFLTFLTLANKNKLFFVKEQLPDTIFAGKKVYHLILILKKEDILKNLSYLPLSFFDTNQIAERLGDVEIEVFIDKKEFFLYSFSIKKAIDLSGLSSFENGKMDLSLDGKFLFGEKDFEILEPPVFTRIDEFLKEISKILETQFFSFFQGFFLE